MPVFTDSPVHQGSISRREDIYFKQGRYCRNLIGFLLNAEQKTAGNSIFYLDKDGTLPLTIQGQSLPSQSFDATTKINEDIRSRNVGLTGGFGLSYGLNSKSTVFLDARAAYGLKSIQKDISVNGDSKTGGLFLTLGYLFSLK